MAESEALVLSLTVYGTAKKHMPWHQAVVIARDVVAASEEPKADALLREFDVECRNKFRM
jgi:hypothetical protein